MSNKLRVYLSSTFSDLKEHRKAVVNALLRLGVEPIALEEFGASDSPPLEACTDALHNADVILFLVARRYGYIPPTLDKSFTEYEYDTAQKLDKPILVFLLNEDHPWPVKLIDAGLTNQKLQSFIKKLKQSRIVQYFTTPEDIAIKITIALSEYLGITPTVEQKDDIAKEPTLQNLMEEIRYLKSTLSAVQQTFTQFSSSFNRQTSHSITPLEFQPAPFFGVASKIIDYNQCFVIMPYTEKWSEGLEKILSEICKEVGIRFKIAKTMDGRFIPNDIWQGITGSGIIIADLTGGNPNVTYEIGLSDVLGREVILISQNVKVPFDFQSQRLLLYEDSISGMIKLREELSLRLQEIKNRSTEK